MNRIGVTVLCDVRSEKPLAVCRIPEPWYVEAMFRALEEKKVLTGMSVFGK